jgi:hypothetical protein
MQVAPRRGIAERTSEASCRHLYPRVPLRSKWPTTPAPTHVGCGSRCRPVPGSKIAHLGSHPQGGTQSETACFALRSVSAGGIPFSVSGSYTHLRPHRSTSSSTNGHDGTASMCHTPARSSSSANQSAVRRLGDPSVRPSGRFLSRHARTAPAPPPNGGLQRSSLASLTGSMSYASPVLAAFQPIVVLPAPSLKPSVRRRTASQ